VGRGRSDRLRLSGQTGPSCCQAQACLAPSPTGTLVLAGGGAQNAEAPADAVTNLNLNRTLFVRPWGSLRVFSAFGFLKTWQLGHIARQPPFGETRGDDPFACISSISCGVSCFMLLILSHSCNLTPVPLITSFIHIVHSTHPITWTLLCGYF
jgi:hypothetical protein